MGQRKKNRTVGEKGKSVRSSKNEGGKFGHLFLRIRPRHWISEGGDYRKQNPYRFLIQRE